MNSFGVSILIPAVDELEIQDVIAAIDQGLDSDSIKETLIVLPKHATQRYRSFLQRLSEEFVHMNFRFITQKGKGIGDALYTGFFTASGTHVLMIASDLENDPADAIRMISISKKHPDCIISASRRLAENGFCNYPRIKLVFNEIFFHFIRVLFHSKQTDPTYLFQCAPRSLQKQIQFSEDHSCFVLEFAFLPEMQGIRYIEVPSVVGNRKSGKTHMHFNDYYLLMKGALKLHKRASAQKD